MHTAISCASCSRPLRIPTDLLGRTVRCPFCTDAFVAVADPTIKLDEAPANKAAAAEEEGAPAPGLPSAAVALMEPEPPVVEESFTVDLAGPAKPAAPPKPWSTWVFVRNDSERRLWGEMQAEISADGVRLYRGRKDLLVPVGCEATWVGGSLVRVVVGSRTVDFQLKKKHAYKSRLAADLAGFLNGDRPMPANRGYRWPWYQWLVLLAPLALIGVLIAGELPETETRGLKGFGIVMFALLVPLLVYWLWHMERLRVGLRWGGSAVLVGGAFFCTALMYCFGPDLPPAAPYAKWSNYAPPGGRYSVQMPATPREYPPERTTNGLTVTKSLARVKSSQTSGIQTFVVAYADLPQWQRNSGNAFALGREYVRSDNNNGSPSGERTINHEEYSGVEFTVSQSSGRSSQVTVRLFFAGGRLYILTVKEADWSNSQKFFDSFHVDAPGRANVPSPVDFPGLIAYWSFDKVQGDWVNEDTGGIEPLRLNGCKSGSGIRKRGLHLPGGPAYFDYGKSPALNFAKDAPFTFAAWFKTQSPDGVLVSQRNSRDLGTIIQLSLQGGRLQSLVCQDGNRQVNRAPATLQANDIASDGDWHHFALVRDADRNVALYFDGAQHGPLNWKDASGPITTDTRTLGCDLLNPRPQNVQGSMDEFCVFRRALAEDEIRRLAGK